MKSDEIRTPTLNYIVTLLAFAKSSGVTIDFLVEWIQKKYQEKGYYSIISQMNKKEKIQTYLKSFVNGRNAIYDDIKISENSEFYEIMSKRWYLSKNLESFFYFDVNEKEFIEFGTKLAKLNAEKYNVKIEFIYDSQNEVVRIYK